MENVQQETRKKDNKSKSIINLDQGRIPPQAVDLEEAVLGALLIDNAAINHIVDILEPESFYKDKHRFIYEAIKELFNKPEPIDILSVSEQLKRNGKWEEAGGDYYLVQLSQRVSSSAHAEYHSRIIIQKHIQRELIRVSSEIIKDSYDETKDVFDLLDESEQKLFAIADGNLKKKYESAQDLITQAIKRIEEISKKDGLSGVPSGFRDLDKLTSGWQQSDLVILAARPGMGKTAFVLSMARQMAIRHNAGVAVFSLEMSSVQLIMRMISSETELESEKLRKGNLTPHEWHQLVTKVKDLENAPIYIDDTPSISVFDLRAKCRRLVETHGVKIIVIDYLQLMTAGGSKSGGNREQEISIISRSLKSIAKELNVPVIALSQLSREVEKRGGSKRPMLSDLRESGAIEQDADIVSFIYRPEYYGFEEWDVDGTPCKAQAELIVAKHRNGSLDNIRLKFEGALARFSDLELDEMTGNTFESKLNETSSFGEQDPYMRNDFSNLTPDEPDF
ncbi:MAG: replicative DNA helicase [Schleiferiaceae bacterium]|nr:replicative DNA helicase [Schleiferiaceae bacterium]